MINETKIRTSWPSIEEFEIKGDYRGRAVLAKHNNNSIRFFIRFSTSGQVQEFKEI